MKVQDPAKVVSVSGFVPASPTEIFNLLADPNQHSLIDGSGSVLKARSDAPERLSLGAKFGMDMKIGMKYKITNEIVEFDEPSLIAWRHFGGHIWRYKLEAVEGGTQVTEQFDWNGSKSPLVLRLRKSPATNKNFMVATLERMAQHFSK